MSQRSLSCSLGVPSLFYQILKIHMYVTLGVQWDVKLNEMKYILEVQGDNNFTFPRGFGYCTESEREMIEV